MSSDLEPHHLRGIQAAIDFAESRLADGPVKASEMAWNACMSPFHFERIFRRTLGISPGAYVRQRRLSEAARRISTTPAAVMEIGMELGFGSTEAFCRAFKAQFFLTPGELRRYGTLPYLLANPMRILDTPRPPLESESEVRIAELPARLCVGLFRRGPNIHAENMRIDYELLRRTQGQVPPERWLFFDRTLPAPPHYEMFLGWEVDCLAHIPLGLEPLVVPAHPALLITHRGYLDNECELASRTRLLHRLASTQDLRIASFSWKLTCSTPCPDFPGYLRWLLEIPLT